MNTILLFGMPGGAELFFIVLIIIMLFGSKKIPELARGLGKGIREIKNATGEIQREITEGTSEINSLKDRVDLNKQIKELTKDNAIKKPVIEEEIKTEIQEENIDSEPTHQPIPRSVQRKSTSKSQIPPSNKPEEE